MDLNNVFNLESPTATEESQDVPQYFKVADSHNIGNDNFQFTNPSTWIDKVTNAGYFAAAASISGLDSLANSAISIGNFFGADLTERNVAADIASLDSDVGAYYTKNKEIVDLAGFVVTSLLPGIGGVKILNAGQKALRGVESAGFLGTNLSRAMNLLSPALEIQRTKAAEEIIKGAATFSLLNTKTLATLASGIHQGVLEGAAFELAVNATMYKSPVLSDTDGWDIAKNVMWSAGLSGAFEGVIQGAKTFSKIKSTVAAFDKEATPFTSMTELGKSGSTSDQLIARFADLDTLDTHLNSLKSADSSPQYADILASKGEKKVTKLNNLIQEELLALSKGDVELKDTLFSGLKGLSSDEVAASLMHSEQLGRLSTTLDAEKFTAKIKGAPEAAMHSTGLVGYVKLFGEGRGSVTFEAPKVINLADKFTTTAEIDSFIKAQKFSTKAPYQIDHLTDHFQVEARHVWADNLVQSRSPSLKDGMVIGETDIPLLEAALTAKINNIEAVRADGYRYAIPSADDLAKHLQLSKIELANKLLDASRAGAKDLDSEVIAKLVNVKRSFLEGEHSTDVASDLFARQATQEAYNAELVSKGIGKDSPQLLSIYDRPSYMKVGYTLDRSAIPDAFQIDAMAQIKSKYNTYMQAYDNILAKYSGDLFGQFYHPSENVFRSADRFGAGSQLFANANGNYHTLASWSEDMGGATNRLKTQLRTSVNTRLESSVFNLARNQEAAIEWASLHQKVAATSEHYVLNPAETALVPKKLAEYQKQLAAGVKNLDVPKIQEGAPHNIPINTAEALEATKAHIEQNQFTRTARREVSSVLGMTNDFIADTFYPIRQNIQDFKHFVFVVDEKVSGAGHVSMIHATSPQELQQLIDKVPSEFKVLTKADSEAYHKAMGDYTYERGLNENYIDSSLKRKGINSPFFIKTKSDDIAKDFLAFHLNQADALARDLVNGKFEKEFLELRRLGEEYTNISTSTYKNISASVAEATTANPYLDYVKTALDISRVSEYPLITSVNKGLDSLFTKAINTVSGLFAETKSASELDSVNSLLQKYGLKSAYYDAATELLANHTAPRGALSKFVRGANSILSTLTTRLDPFSALNNAIGANVLLGAETGYVTRAIQRGDTAAVGELASLMKLEIPGVKEAIRSPTKLIVGAMRNFFEDSSGELMKKYKANGWVTDISSQFRSMLDDLTLVGDETEAVLNSKMTKAFKKAKDLAQKGEMLTGNKFAEEFNRFVAANVMDQITGIATKYGVIGTDEAQTMINTFVKRTQGNILASQRPLMFQGAVGQAIGLFQSFQFNTMQQLFRYVGEGTAKDAALMLGLQGTIFGLNGLPAFNAINTHILGTLSNNPKHIDAYSATYGATGKSVGDLLLYGLPSNLLRANLYTRGDINPRSATVIPTSFADIPIVNGFIKTVNGIQDTVSKIHGGGDVWRTVLQGIEHTSLNRPLSGLAQVAEAATNQYDKVYSTTSKGDLVASNDLFSLASLTRIAGAKPLDEAIVTDYVYRSTAYAALDAQNKVAVGKSLKSTVIGGGMPSQEQVNGFARDYMMAGGKQKDFNKWMFKQTKQANTTQADKIMLHLGSPYAKGMQELMGGREGDEVVF